MATVESNPAQWLPNSFDRVPHWRFLRAHYLIDGKLNCDARIDDDWVARVIDALETTKASSKSCSVHAALALWNMDPPERRWLLEARLLTDETYPRIAIRVGIPATVIEAYCQIFFDVRTGRPGSDWLWFHAVGYSSLSGFTGPQPSSYWKYAAVHGGSPALDMVIAVTTNGPLPRAMVAATGKRSVEEDRLLREKVILWLQLLAARTDAEVAGVIEARGRLRKQEGNISRPSSPGTGYLPAMEQFLTLLPAMRRRAEAGEKKSARIVRTRRPSNRSKKNAILIDAAQKVPSCPVDPLLAGCDERNCAYQSTSNDTDKRAQANDVEASPVGIDILVTSTGKAKAPTGMLS